MSFEVRAGEIVGIAGVDGNGQTELIDALAGLRERRRPASSRSTDGRHERQRARDPRCRARPHPRGPSAPRARPRLHARREPRAPRLRRRRVEVGWLFPRAADRASARRAAAGVRRPRRSPRRSAGALSGGNQQKVVVAREIDRDPKVLDRRAADARARRRRDRVRPPPARRGARRGPRACCSSRSSSRRSCRSPTGSSSCTRARSSASSRPSVSEEELGVAMTGGGQEGGARERAAASGRRRGADPELGRSRRRAPPRGWRSGRRAGGLLVSARHDDFRVPDRRPRRLSSRPARTRSTTYRAIFEGAGFNWFFQVGSYELRIPFTDAHIPFLWNVNDIESTAAFNLQQTLHQLGAARS